MKLFKTVFAASAVAVMLASCTDVTEATNEELEEEGITLVSGKVYNSQGGNDAQSGFDVVQGKNVGASAGVNVDKTPKYTPADSSRVDFRTINSNGRFESTLTAQMTSVNKTVFAPVSKEDFEGVTKNIKTFKTKLKKMGDDATSKIISFSETSPYYVARLKDKDGNARGYALVVTTSFNAEDTSLTSKTNVGSIGFNYYYITEAKASE